MNLTQNCTSPIQTMLLLWLLATPTYADWEMVDETPLAEGPIESISLALDQHGSPWVAFKDSNVPLSKATVMKFENYGWRVIGNRGFSDGQADFLSLIIDSQDTPYVAYQDLPNGGGVNVKKWLNGRWQVVGSENLANGQVGFTSFARDPQDILYLAYQDIRNGGKATVRKFTGDNWKVVGINPLSKGLANFISLALDKQGIPYVAYTDWDTQKVTVRKLAGMSWERVGDEELSEGLADFTKLAFDNLGRLYVAYRDFQEHKQITIKTFQDNRWQVVGNRGLSSCQALPFSLVLDAEGTPYVAYQCTERSWGYHVYVKRFYNHNWDFTFTSSEPAKYPSLAFDNPTKTLYVAFNEGAEADSSRAIVMKYSFASKIKLLGGASLALIETESTPSSEKGTYFETQVGKSITHTFVLSNVGDLNLILADSIKISNSQECKMFQVMQSPSPLTKPLEFNLFTVTFTPLKALTLTCTIHIMNNSHQNPYSFIIQGTATN